MPFRGSEQVIVQRRYTKTSIRKEAKHGVVILRVLRATLITVIRIFNAQKLTGNQLVQSANSVSQSGAKNLAS